MRLVIRSLFISLFVLSTPVRAQEASPACRPISPTVRVTVQMQDGASLRGTLLCLTDEDFVLVSDGQSMTAPLARVTRIESRRDPFWDGAVKGAAIPLILFALFCDGHCDAQPVMRAAAAYGLVGLTLDALQTNSRTIYTGRPRPAVSWRLRF
jgi:hypothetical protein